MVAELQQTIKDLLSQVEDLRRSGAEKDSHIAQMVCDFAVLVFGMQVVIDHVDRLTCISVLSESCLVIHMPTSMLILVLQR